MIKRERTQQYGARVRGLLKMATERRVLAVFLAGLERQYIPYLNAFYMLLQLKLLSIIKIIKRRKRIKTKND